MKISTKIILLVAALLGFLGGNAYISWQEINRINGEFNEVVKDDLTLMESATALNELQLKKEVLFEKLASSAEELAFGNANESRRQYLLDYVKDLHEQFQNNSSMAKTQIDQALRLSETFKSLTPMLQSVKQAVALYDRKVDAIFTAVSGAGYQLSMEDLDDIQTQQTALAKDLQKTLKDVWMKVNASIERINELRQKSQHVLWVSLTLSLIFALLLASAIIRRIHTSLNVLVHGVRALHQGQLGSHVAVKSTDEIGELANAFNGMSDQLKKYQQDMQTKNIELAKSLDVTKEQKKELEKINRDLDRFVQLISHDINGPLSGVIGYSAYLQKHSEGFDEKTVNTINHLRESSQRLDRMVKDLLEMTKITRTRRPFEKLDIGLIVQEAVDRQSFLIEKTSAVIRFPQNFPVVMADRLKLTVVFFNLIGNAIKYSSKDGNKPQVDISWETRPEDVMFCIKDNGIGIAREYYQAVFDMFKRLPEAQSFEGSGVGLAIVKEIIHEHSGHIWVESTPGCGAQFFFTIPLESASRLS
ncbi:MAG: HAMP domain-containing protein [Candidatus Omnitrophica bacterium]|nr:HAMP domain-containing protein [Candidatus Omnitrophota bacterium]